MSPASILRTAIADARRQSRRSVLLVLGSALSVALLLLTTAFALGVRQHVYDRLLQMLPIDTVEVVPRALDLGLFSLGTDKLLGGPTLDEAAIGSLRKLPGVRAVYPKLDVALPLGARGGKQLFGRDLYTDLFLTGLPGDLVDAPDFVDGPQLPLVVSPQLIDIFNTSVAPPLGAPKLSAEVLEGFQFEVVIGRSLMLGGRGAARTGAVPARVVGTSRFAKRLGASIPLVSAQRLLRDYGQPGMGASYTSALVRLEHPDHAPAVAEAVSAMGFALDESDQKVAVALDAAVWIGSVFGLLLLLLATFGVGHAFSAQMSERRKELAVLRAVGASRAQLLGLVLGQAFVLGIVGGVLATVGAVGVAHIAQWALAQAPLGGGLLPASLFLFPSWLWIAGVAVAPVASILGAAGPALGGVRRSVARTLSEL